MKKLLCLITMMSLITGSQAFAAQQEEEQTVSMQAQEVIIHTDPGVTISINENTTASAIHLTNQEILKKYVATIALPVLIGVAAGVLCKKVDMAFDFNPLLLLLATWPLTASLRIALIEEFLNDIGNGEIIYNKPLAQTINSIAAWVGWIMA